MQPDESNIGIVFWIVLLVVVNALWISMDIWLHRHGHEYLTTEFREGLQAPVWGLILAFLTGGTIGLALFHFFVAGR